MNRIHNKPAKPNRLYHVDLDWERLNGERDYLYCLQPTTVCARTPSQARYFAWLKEVAWEERAGQWPFQAFLRHIVKGVRLSDFQRRECGTESCPCR